MSFLAGVFGLPNQFPWQLYTHNTRQSVKDVVCSGNSLVLFYFTTMYAGVYGGEEV